MTYTSINNQRIKDLKKLYIKKYRDQENKFLIEGYHLVYEAYKAGILEEIFILENEQIDIDVKTNYVSKEVIKYLSDVETPQNIIGLCKKMDKNEITDKVVMLDNIQDPGNLGTIIRSMIAFNFDTLILSEDTIDIYNPKVIRASQGMIFKINIIKTNLINQIDTLENKGYTIYATKVTDGKDVKSLEKDKKICIIMGNEGNGVRKEILDKVNNYLYIKMNEKCESLNVAVALSILLYELGSD